MTTQRGIEHVANNYQLWVVTALLMVLCSCAAAMRPDDFLLSYGTGPFQAQLTRTEESRRTWLIQRQSFLNDFGGRRIIVPEHMRTSTHLPTVYATPGFSERLRHTHPLTGFTPIGLEFDSIGHGWVKLRLDDGLVVYMHDRNFWIKKYLHKPLILEGYQLYPFLFEFADPRPGDRVTGYCRGRRISNIPFGSDPCDAKVIYGGSDLLDMYEY